MTLDKYQDWQRYVKEQMEKADQKKRETGPTSPKRVVPSIEGDRFAIKRQSWTEPERNPDGASRVAPPREASAARVPKEPEGTKSSLASPFVSVQDVWEAAEKTTKSRKTHKEETPAFRQDKLPGIERVAPRSAAGTPPAPQPQNRKEQSREEILERLVNPTISLEEAAKIMGVCKATVRRYTAKGILPHYRTPGNQRRFKLNDIINFLENQRI
jgi:excisionase family DNA binding protein